MELKSSNAGGTRTPDMARYDFTTKEGRQLFNAEVESGLYGGINADKEPVLVFQQQNCGLDVWTRHHAKPNWYEVVMYDSEGYQEGVTYKHI